MHMLTEPLECRKLTAEWKQALLVFLAALETTNDAEYFHPHAFTDDALEKVIRNARKDLYYILAEGQKVLGYGMLRGWDEGYEIPSLGIAIHPEARSVGLGKVLMHFLHTAARRRGDKKVRLKVKTNNHRAVHMYQGLGYSFESQEGPYLVGFLDLAGGHG
jgi:ribosomal-protein-alanine N-acetyltransferase